MHSNIMNSHVEEITARNLSAPFSLSSIIKASGNEGKIDLTSIVWRAWSDERAVMLCRELYALNCHALTYRDLVYSAFIQRDAEALSVFKDICALLVRMRALCASEGE